MCVILFFSPHFVSVSNRTPCRMDLDLGVARDQKNIMSCSVPLPSIANASSNLFPCRNKLLWTLCRSARSASGPLWRSDWRASSVVLPSWLTLHARVMIAESASWLSAILCARLFRTFCLSIWAM